MSAIPFLGFRKPDDEYFRLPNEWTDITAEIDNLAELKVIEYILRYTWGYQHYEGLISIKTDEFMHGKKSRDGERLDKGTGLSKQSVVDGVKRAIADGYIVCVVDDSDKARVKKFYGLKLSNSLPSDVQKIDLQSSTSLTSEVYHPDSQTPKSLTPDVKHLDSDGQASRQRSRKETRERNSHKDIPKESSTAATLTSEQQIWFNEVYCQSDFAKVGKASNPLTNTLQKHIRTLSASIQTVEGFNSLHRFTADLPFLKGKTIHAGNLVYSLQHHFDEWQEYQQREATILAWLNNQQQQPAKEEAQPEESTPIAEAITSVSRERGERMGRAGVEADIDYTLQLYRASGLAEADFMRVVEQAARETAGPGMNSFFVRLERLATLAKV